MFKQPEQKLKLKDVVAAVMRYGTTVSFGAFLHAAVLGLDTPTALCCPSFSAALASVPSLFPPIELWLQTP